MPQEPLDYVEQLQRALAALELQESSNRSLSTYLHSLADSIGRAAAPDDRLPKAEAALETALAYVAILEAKLGGKPAFVDVKTELDVRVHEWREAQKRKPRF